MARREFMLRQRIDRLTDERDAARAKLEETRLRARKATTAAYTQRKRAELWRARCRRLRL